MIAHTLSLCAETDAIIAVLVLQESRVRGAARPVAIVATVVVLGLHQFTLALRRGRVLLGKHGYLSDATLGRAEVQPVEILACMAGRLTDLADGEILPRARAHRCAFGARTSLHGHELKKVTPVVDLCCIDRVAAIAGGLGRFGDNATTSLVWACRGVGALQLAQECLVNHLIVHVL